jgi:DcmR-like sensory protein
MAENNDSMRSAWLRRSGVVTVHDPFLSGHFVQFYEHDNVLVENVCRMALRGLSQNGSAVLVATEAHRIAIESRLGVLGLNIADLLTSGRLTSLDADETLSKFMVDGWPDEARFHDVVGGVIGSAAERSENQFVLAFGEMVALLCAAGNSKAAIRLEQLWNELAKVHKFSLLCAYPLSTFKNDFDGATLLQVCAEHSLAIPAESPL